MDEGLVEGEEKRKFGVVWDGSAVGPKFNIRIPERQELPSIQDVMAVLQYFEDRGIEPSAVKIDFKAAFERVRVREEDTWMLTFRVAEEWRRFLVCPFGMRSSGCWWCKAVGVLHRCVHKLWADVLRGGMIYVDDGIWVVEKSKVEVVTAVVLLFLKIVGSPISWKKMSMGQDHEWCRYAVSLRSGRVGLTGRKQQMLADSIEGILTKGDRASFVELQKLTCRMAW